MHLIFSGSYSPRFFGRKYVNPNMSRYRIHSHRSGVTPPHDDENLMYDEFTDDDEIDEDVNDSDSDVSYERGMTKKRAFKI